MYNQGQGIFCLMKEDLEEVTEGKEVFSSQVSEDSREE